MGGVPVVKCVVRWIGSVWHCRTHDRYIEDGDVCPKAEGP